MRNVLLDIVGTNWKFWRRSSFGHWLLGVFLTALAGILLHALNHPAQANSPLPLAAASTGSCLQAAGADLKHGELLARDAACNGTTAN